MCKKYWTGALVIIAVATSLLGCRTAPDQPDGASEAGSRFLRACSEKDWGKAGQLCMDPLPDAVKERFGGIEVIRVGNSHARPHAYEGRFVPYKVRFPDGKVLKRELAMKADAGGKWLVDGGL
jgi:hypothetical protein